jgi:hypothetical protein
MGLTTPHRKKLIFSETKEAKAYQKGLWCYRKKKKIKSVYFVGFCYILLSVVVFARNSSSVSTVPEEVPFRMVLMHLIQYT